jgi:hypothetical protein
LIAEAVSEPEPDALEEAAAEVCQALAQALLVQSRRCP